MYYKKYEGESIYFSPLNENDFAIYTKWLNDINQAHNIISEYKEKNWILHDYEKDRYQFAVVDKKTNKAIGIYGLELKNKISNRYYFVGFIGEKSYRGHGIGTEALKLLTKFAFDILNAHSIYTSVYNFNEASLKSINKAKFTKCGEYRESIYYNSKYYNEILFEMTRDDYNNLKGEVENNEKY